MYSSTPVRQGVTPRTATHARGAVAGAEVLDFIDESSAGPDETNGNREMSEGRRRGRRRKFVHRARFQRQVRAKRGTPVKPLWTNYSRVHEITPAQSKFLNLGPNFCDMPKKFNRTEVEASLLRWERSMRWREFWSKQRQQQGHGGGRG